MRSVVCCSLRLYRWKREQFARLVDSWKIASSHRGVPWGSHALGGLMREKQPTTDTLTSYSTGHLFSSSPRFLFVNVNTIECVLCLHFSTKQTPQNSRRHKSRAIEGFCATILRIPCSYLKEWRSPNATDSTSR